MARLHENTPAMHDFAELRLKPTALARYGLPDIAYPVPAADLVSGLVGDGDLPLATLLRGLQQRGLDGDAQWRQVEPAMDRLAELLATAGAGDVLAAAGDVWWLEIGPVDLAGKLVTIQRGDALIAAITARDDGHLRVAVFPPLDGGAGSPTRRWPLPSIARGSRAISGTA